MEELFQALLEGKRKCDLNFPNVRTLKVEIMSVNLWEHAFRPIKIKVLDKGVTHEITEMEHQGVFGGDEGDYNSVLVKKNVPYKEDWVDLQYLSNFSK